MARKNPETVVVSGFFEPISFSVRNVGCGDRVRVSGGHLCAKHRSTDRGGSRDLEPVRTNFVCLHSCGARQCAHLERGAFVDRCASFCSLYHPQGALANSLRKPVGRRFAPSHNKKNLSVPKGTKRFFGKLHDLDICSSFFIYS